MNCEVTEHNFEHQLESIKLRLSSADFIAIDRKCTNHTPENQHTNNLLATAEEQFYSIKQNINKFRIIQLNLTTFHYIKKENKYSTCSHIFYLYKRYVRTNQAIVFQYSAIKFLRDINFDFNALFKGGITYLNLPEEMQLKKDLASYSVKSPYDWSFDSALGFKTKFQEDTLEGACVLIYTWLKANDEEKTITLDDLNYDDKLLRYLVIKQINLRFGMVWASYSDTGKIVVQKVTEFERGRFETEVEKQSCYEKEFLTSCIGFSHIFKHLISLKITLVGHDMFSNLVTMYNQFHKPLPDTYKEFKKDMNSMFPCIYDTKFISNKLQEKFNSASKWGSHELDLLYQYFKESSEDCYSPTIKLVDAYHKNVSNMDLFREKPGLNVSFKVGYCFISMMHFFVTENNKLSHIDPKPLPCKELLSVVKKYKNSVYTCIDNINYMNLDGTDPKPSTHRYHILVSAKEQTEVDTRVLKDKFSSASKSLTVTRVSKDRVLVGTKFRNEIDILLNIIKSENLEVVERSTSVDLPANSKIKNAVAWSVASISFAVASWIFIKFSRSKN